MTWRIMAGVDVGTSEALRTSQRRGPMARGRLRVYLGTAPGVGKTYAMLRDALARRDRDEDVVVGVVETHGRPHTIEALEPLEVVPRREVVYHGTVLGEMDLDAIIRRRPDLTCVDELAHVNPPGLANAQRWQDVEALRDTGIDVATTLNIEQLESLQDVVEDITGTRVHETVPDTVVENADEVEFIDLAPEALRERVREGDVYPPGMIVAALTHYFRIGNLGALREIGLRLMSERTDPVPASPLVGRNVLVLVPDGPTSEPLIRRGARMARRYGGTCTVLAVLHPRHPEPARDDGWRSVAERVGAVVAVRTGADLVRTVAVTATELGVHHVVVGQEPAGWRHTWRHNLVQHLLEDLPDVDLHVYAGQQAGRASRHGEEVEARPDPDALLRSLQPRQVQGSLHIRLGHAHGCGTTTAMLDEAVQRRSRGADVVVAAIDTHGHPGCDDLLSRLEVLGGLQTPWSRALDVDALLARNPEIAGLDDLAAPAVDGRAAAVHLERVLAAGISVMATLHVADLIGPGLEGLTPVSPRRPSLPTSLLERAEEIEVVDATPHDLLDRLRRGELTSPGGTVAWAPDELDPDVEGALRSAAFRLVAEHTDRRLLALAAISGDRGAWKVRPCVLACVPPRPGMERMIFRARAIALRSEVRFTAVTVVRSDLSDAEQRTLAGYASLVLRLGGDFTTLRDGSVADALTGHARACRAAEVVLCPRRDRRHGRKGTVRTLLGGLPEVDVHLLGR